MAEDGGDIRAITLRLPEAQHEALRTLAFIEETSINELVLRAVRGYLAAQHRIEKFDAMLDRARAQYRELLGRDEVSGPKGPVRTRVGKATTAGLRRARTRLGEMTGGYEEQLDELAQRAHRVRDLGEQAEIQRLIDAARAGFRAASDRLAADKQE
ncbi:MAG TPA: hypothetical protein VH498_09700 [Candidatus Dormibacteraeota bacterium]|nr:hypothetical protein [Candidatus Dormibacteraeota bacterium]